MQIKSMNIHIKCDSDILNRWHRIKIIIYFLMHKTLTFRFKSNHLYLIGIYSVQLSPFFSHFLSKR